MKRKSDLYDKIIAFTKRKKFHFENSDARRLVGVAMAFAPMLSLIAATRFIILILYSFFKELGLKVDAESMVNITPSHASISNVICDTAAHTLAVARCKTYKVPISCSMDAGNEDGKHFMVKKSASWHHPTDSLFVFTIDSNACEGTNKRAVEGIDVSLIKLDHPDHSVTLINMSTDSGGGGVFVNLITKFCGVGGVKNHNSLQLIFTCWAIEQEFELDTWKNMWFRVNKVTCGRRQVQPILTRWEYVGEFFWR